MIDREERVRIASDWYNKLDISEKDVVGIPTYGSVSFAEANTAFFDKIYSENFILCYSTKYNHILSRINSAIEDKRSTNWISDNSAKAAKDALIFKQFSSMEAKEAHKEALEDNNLTPTFYNPELGYLLMKYGKTEIQNNN